MYLSLNHNHYSQNTTIKIYLHNFTFLQIREKNEHNNIVSSFARLDQSYCSLVSLFISIDEFWIIAHDEMGHVSHDPSNVFVPAEINLFVAQRFSSFPETESVASCSVSISVKMNQDFTELHKFELEGRLENNFGFFVGSTFVLNEKVKMDLKFCENFVSFRAIVKCSGEDSTIEDEKQKLVYVSCYGNILNWNKFQVK